VRTWADYLVPGSDVLRNKLRITDADELRTVEEALAAARALHLRQHPMPPRFDFGHFRAIHRCMFQDVYDWAGQPRTAPWDEQMTKDGPDVVNYAPHDPAAPKVAYGYYPAAGIVAAQEALHARLAGDDYLRDLGRQRFTAQLAEYWCEINVVHAFREGNTRTQMVFFAQLCEQAGWPLDLTRFAPGDRLAEDFALARFYGQATGDSSRLAGVLGPTLRAG